MKERWEKMYDIQKEDNLIIYVHHYNMCKMHVILSMSEIYI